MIYSFCILVGQCLEKLWINHSYFNNERFIVTAAAAAAATKSLQSCLTLCYPIDRGPPGSPVPGILQARILCHFLLQWRRWGQSKHAHSYSQGRVVRSGDRGIRKREPGNPGLLNTGTAPQFLKSKAQKSVGMSLFFIQYKVSITHLKDCGEGVSWRLQADPSLSSRS